MADEPGFSVATLPARSGDPELRPPRQPKGPAGALPGGRWKGSPRPPGWVGWLEEDEGSPPPPRPLPPLSPNTFSLGDRFPLLRAGV